MNDLVLLAALLRGPAYGYSLKKTAGLIFGNSAMHNNIIYPALKKFMRNGWVEQATVQGDRGQQRKQYRITVAGRKYLLEQLGTFGDREAREEEAFLLRLAFFDVLPKRKREAFSRLWRPRLESNMVSFASVLQRSGVGAQVR